MKNFFFIFCFIGAILNLASAQKNFPNDATLVNRQPSLGFRIAPCVNQRAQIINQIGRYQLGSLKQIGGEVGVDYYYSLSHNSAMIYGLTVGFNSRNFTLFIPRSDYSPAAIADQNYSGVLTKELTPYLRVPVLFEIRILETKSTFLNFALGGSLSYSLGFQSDNFEGYMYDINGDKVKDFSMDLTSNNFGKPWLSLDFRSGFTQLLLNKHFTQISFVGSLATKKFITGNYEITVPGQTISRGLYGVKQSFINVSFSYILSKSAKPVMHNR